MRVSAGIFFLVLAPKTWITFDVGTWTMRKPASRIHQHQSVSSRKKK